MSTCTALCSCTCEQEIQHAACKGRPLCACAFTSACVMEHDRPRPCKRSSHCVSANASLTDNTGTACKKRSQTLFFSKLIVCCSVYTEQILSTKRRFHPDVSFNPLSLFLHKRARIFSTACSERAYIRDDVRGSGIPSSPCLDSGINVRPSEGRLSVEKLNHALWVKV